MRIREVFREKRGIEEKEGDRPLSPFLSFSSRTDDVYFRRKIKNLSLFHNYNDRSLIWIRFYLLYLLLFLLISA